MFKSSILAALLLTACGGKPECGVKECADLCAQATPAPAPATKPTAAKEQASMSDFEAKLLNPLIQDLRQGVRPFGDEGIGICEGEKRECKKFLGTSVSEELPPGEYMLRAELAVPKTGGKDTWKVKFHLECTRTRETPKGNSSTTSNQDREYNVVYAGKERGYRLQPLWNINSPGKYGAEDCKYKITAPHPDGDKVYSGSWHVPAEKK